MSDQPDNLLDQLLELVVYLPVGLFLDSRGRVDEIVGRGREHTTSQVRLARMIGQFAVTIGRKEVERRVADVFTRPSAGPPAPPGEPAPADAPATVQRTAAPSPPPGAAPARRPASRPPRPAGPRASTAGAPTLAIEGYDTLAASQVIARLDGLTARQLAAVRRHEAAHRNRKTILGRIDQLAAR